MSDDRYLLSSVYNSLEVLDLLSEYDELSLADINKKLPFGKGSIFKMLYTLEKKGYVIKSDDAKYRLSYKFARYGNHVLEKTDTLAVAKPYLRKLCNKLNETVHMARLVDSRDVIFIWKELSKTTIQMASRIGVALPAYCTGVGKVLLANLQEDELEAALSDIKLIVQTPDTITTKEGFLKELAITRERRYAIDAEESEVGLTCFAAAIRNVDGRAHTAISVSGPSWRMNGNKANIVDSLLEVAEEISQALGCQEY